MFNVSNKGAATRYIGKSVTADMIGGYLATVEGLYKFLKVINLKFARYSS